MRCKLTNGSEFTGAALDENLRLTDEFLHEAIACVFLVVPFFAAHDFGIDLAGQCALGVVHGVGHLAECTGANDQDVNVTLRARSAFGHGAEDEGHFNVLHQGLQGLGQHVNESGGFADEARQFGVDRVVGVGAELGLVAHFLLFQQSRSAERVEFFFQGPRGCLGHPRQLSEVHPFVRVHHQQGQYFAPVLVGKEEV